MCGHITGCHTVGDRGHKHLVSRGQGAAKYPMLCRTAAHTCNRELSGSKCQQCWDWETCFNYSSESRCSSLLSCLGLHHPSMGLPSKARTLALPGTMPFAYKYTWNKNDRAVSCAWLLIRAIIQRVVLLVDMKGCVCDKCVGLVETLPYMVSAGSPHVLQLAHGWWPHLHICWMADCWQGL